MLQDQIGRYRLEACGTKLFCDVMRRRLLPVRACRKLAVDEFRAFARTDPVNPVSSLPLLLLAAPLRPAIASWFDDPDSSSVHDDTTGPGRQAAAPPSSC